MQQKYLFRFLVGLLLVVVILAYSNHWHNDFHFDDAHTVQSNIYIQHIGNIPLFFKDCKTFSSIPSHGSYRPVVSTTLAIDYWMGGGLNPVYFHLSTFILFLLQGVLMFFFFKKILDTVAAESPTEYIALFASGWYLLNPVNAETINYVISRSDSLSTFFVLLAFVLYQYSDFARKTFLYLVPVFIGALAKPTAIMFGPILVGYHLILEQQVRSVFAIEKYNWGRLLKVALPSILLFVGVYALVKHMEEGMFVPGGSSLSAYVLSQPFVYLHYVGMFLLPLQLSADTDWSVFADPFAPQVIVGWLFLAGLLVTLIYTADNKRLKPIAFGIIWFLLSLVPTTFVPLAEVMNDHRMFYPHVGTVLALTWAGYLLLQKFWAGTAHALAALLCVLGLSAYASGTYERNKVWATEASLWKDVTEKSPMNGRGQMNYGLTLMAKGDYEGAEKCYAQGLKLLPTYSLQYTNMATVKEAKGNYREADFYYQKGIEYGADYPGNYYFYGRYLYKQGRKEEAINKLTEALKRSDALTDARYLLMSALYEAGRLEELRTLCNSTLKILPNDGRAKAFLASTQGAKSILQLKEDEVALTPSPEGYLGLSLLYYNAQRYEDCIKAAEQALKLKPDYAEAYNNICSAYNALKRYKEAAQACEKALEIQPGYQLARNNLNLAKMNL